MDLRYTVRRQTSAMAAGITIRRYQDDDKETVKEIFTMGMSEHVPSSFMHLLKQPLTQMILMVTFCALLASSKSVLLPVVGVTLLLAGAKQLVGYLFNSYIDTSLRKDLDHIQETYLENKDSCFWVAESDDRVVATVACLPAEREPGCMELKRLSVRRTHRGMGIAKALCRTVADFSRERGFPAVVLYTSVVQTDAQRLYENLGYTRVREFVIPEPIAKIANFTLIEYRLDLLQGGK
ncbi:probable N-acetyltransferase CML1 isoform X1 [Salvelinus namaycush]|uniref:Probable N-acetyltransferase CML1 isoform X1 n=2 Tax=Salvelinus namaycush TaxID=8040 RepID=A0A8U1EW62_SALNM|nr:probable N-acetyltransferase CML1 isoform X1 [Salvelinus namaycush]